MVDKKHVDSADLLMEVADNTDEGTTALPRRHLDRDAGLATLISPDIAERTTGRGGRVYFTAIVTPDWLLSPPTKK